MHGIFEGGSSLRMSGAKQQRFHIAKALHFRLIYIKCARKHQTVPMKTNFRKGGHVKSVTGQSDLV